ncbi:MAG: DNA polymerase/3'-5' exonuclease PolX [Sedimentisphaerales bacterium]|nr:DNA polymerase/3'-5' exonuclease PolX [Sedimentisphaerales bacterium]
MTNQRLSDLFEQMADIMEILDEDRFRIATYRKVARAIADCPQDVAQLAAQGRPIELAGVGKSSLQKIHEFVHHGAVQAHQDLLGRIPPGLLELLNIPGFGPKSAAAVWKHLKVETLADLQRVIEDKSLETLAGFGPKKAESIARGIQFLAAAGHRIRLAEALALADLIVGQLRTCPGLQEIEVAGSLRRGCETVGDIDLLAQAADGGKILEAFTRLPGVQRVLGAGPTKASIQFAWPEICNEIVQVDLRIVPAESFGAAWQYFTGSKYHNVKLREIAAQKHLKLNEYGLFAAGTSAEKSSAKKPSAAAKSLAGRTERQIYQKLGLAYIAPTLREDRGEIERAQKNKLPLIVELKDIQGDLHMHSPASDGRHEVAQLVEAARRLGYHYIAISDHSQSSAIANGLDAKRLRASIDAVRTLNESLKRFTVLISSEVDILMDGSLDYPDEVLAELDFVIASVHSGLTGPRQRNTSRLLKAMDNPYVNCIGHPTGRMIHVREPMDLDMELILHRAAETHTAMEVSASPLRLDLNDIHCRQAIDAGVKLVINTDAHDTHGLGQMSYGVATAQRGWATKADVLNAQPLRAVRAWVRQKRPR